MYNGNIAQAQWRTASTDNTLKSYSYTYDALNRITGALDNSGNYDVSNITYDKMGNILTLTRDGWQDNGGTITYPDMDILDYDYDTGNRLLKVSDSGSNTYGFKDGTNPSDDYTYNNNGNMTSDANKGITDIDYNHLNMPVKITVTGTNAGVLDYVYAADRTKFQKKKTQGGVTTTTDYIGNYVYENGNLKQISHAGGYVEPDGTGWQYVYYLKDHQNNVRITFADDNGNRNIETGSSYSEIRREQNYYPFGLEHKGYNDVLIGVKNDLKTYQNQEFTEDLGLNVHEWKYRFGDPAIGRFWQVDPLAEDYAYNSTYAFQENKLGMGIELEGLEVVYRKGASPEFKEKFAKTVKFMNSKGTSGKLAELNESGRTELVDNTGGGTFYRRKEGAIYFDPTTGIETVEGNSLSPATMLDHEIDHRLQDIENPDQMTKDLNTPDEAYSNKEEKRVITGSEQETAKKHGEIQEGEVTRTSHREGTLMTTDDPTSMENATPKVTELEEIILTPNNDE